MAKKSEAFWSGLHQGRRYINEFMTVIRFHAFCQKRNRMFEQHLFGADDAG